MSKEANYEHSTLRERIIEHAFVGEVLRKLWCLGVLDVEVLRSEFDAHGYDLVLTRGPVIRHIQLKTGTKKKPVRVSVSSTLEQKPSGCVIWIRVSDHLEMKAFFWFGSPPGERLPEISRFPAPKRATHNARGIRRERRNHRSIPGSKFREIPNFTELLMELLGAQVSPGSIDRELLENSPVVDELS